MFIYLVPALIVFTDKHPVVYSSLNIDGWARGYDCQNLACNDELRINNSAENPQPPAGYQLSGFAGRFSIFKAELSTEGRVVVTRPVLMLMFIDIKPGVTFSIGRISGASSLMTGDWDRYQSVFPENWSYKQNYYEAKHAQHRAELTD